MKVVQNIFYVILAMLPLPVLAQSSADKVSTIVIDAGHGGVDPGAVSGKTYEKDIVLKVALALGKMIQENLPDMKVVYTRTTDVKIDLYERGNIANRAKADLFISIHADASKSTAANGNSTFIMGTSKDKVNLELAMRENSVIKYEDDYETKYEGFNPNSPDSYIIFSLMQFASGEQSAQVAATIQRHYATNTGLTNRGASQAGYLVLWRTTMPAVLTEIGFVTNDNDRKFITSESGQKKIVTSLFNAISEYKSKVEGKTGTVLLPCEKGVPTTTEEPKSEPVTQSESCFYAVQVCSSPAKVSLNSRSFGEYKGKVFERKVAGVYKYYTGSCSSHAEAVELQKKVRKSIQGAFVVGFKNDNPVTAAELKKHLGK